MAPTSERLGREAAFWDDHVVPLDACLDAVQAGPDPNSAALLGAVEPLVGCRVLDFACGSGITSAWAAQRGARVTAVDVSSRSIARAAELAAALELDVDARVLAEPLPDLGTFDVVFGRYALHHVDLGTYLPWLADRLAPDGRAAFLETVASNPALALARRLLPGRLGVVSMGSDDEHPLRRRDLAAIGERLGPVETRVGQLNCFKLIDRRLLRGRWPWAGRTLVQADQALQRLPGSSWLSYHQVLAVDRRP